jgi:ketosteroid isomerase-like protein
MKIGSLLTIAGLVISFAAPVLAQQKDTTAQIVQQRDLLGVAKGIDEFGELSLKLDEAFNKNDASAIAALFTEDGIPVASDGMFSGRQDIKKGMQDTSQRSPITDFNSRRERRHLNAIDNAVWSAGQWASNLQRQTGPVFVWGFWSAIYIREGDAWKIRMLTLSEHPSPVAETK